MNLLDARAKAGQWRRNDIADEKNFTKAFTLQYKIVRCLDQRGIDGSSFHRSDTIGTAVQRKNLEISIGIDLISAQHSTGQGDLSLRQRMKPKQLAAQLINEIDAGPRD